MNLYRLVYSSQASSALSPEDLKNISDVSQKNNQLDGITGLLCYGNLMFLQILEGEHEQVNKTYHRIVGDKRHHTPILIECVPIKNRLFEVWSMQTINLTELADDQINTLILKYSSSPKFKPNGMSPEQCLNFMQEVANIYELSDSLVLDF
jgi:hypothetical protein